MTHITVPAPLTGLISTQFHNLTFFFPSSLLKSFFGLCLLSKDWVALHSYFTRHATGMQFKKKIFPPCWMCVSCAFPAAPVWRGAGPKPGRPRGSRHWQSGMLHSGPWVTAPDAQSSVIACLYTRGNTSQCKRRFQGQLNSIGRKLGLGLHWW